MITILCSLTRMAWLTILWFSEINLTTTSPSTHNPLQILRWKMNGAVILDQLIPIMMQRRSTTIILPPASRSSSFKPKSLKSKRRIPKSRMSKTNGLILTTLQSCSSRINSWPTYSSKKLKMASNLSSTMSQKARTMLSRSRLQVQKTDSMRMINLKTLMISRIWT